MQDLKLVFCQQETDSFREAYEGSLTDFPPHQAGLTYGQSLTVNKHVPCFLNKLESKVERS